MHLQMTATSLLLTLAPLTIAVPPSSLDARSNRLAPRACGEKADRVCFGVNGGTSQGVTLDDVQYVADYLRFIAEDSPTPALWTMPAPDLGCAEWTIPIEAGSVLALAKHISPRVNSSVLYTDIANTIDGGVNASDKEKKESLLGACGTHGGMVGVKVNKTDPAYSSAEYKKLNAKPEGIIIKIVMAPSS